MAKGMPPRHGEINKTSPSTGLVSGAVSKGLDIGLSCTSAGAGAVWAAEAADAAAGEPAELVKLSQADLSEVARGTLPPGAAPGPIRCVLAAGGLVYVTDGVGSVLTVQP